MVKTGKDFSGASVPIETHVTVYSAEDGGYELWIRDKSVILSRKEADNLGRYLLFDEGTTQEEK